MGNLEGQKAGWRVKGQGHENEVMETARDWRGTRLLVSMVSQAERVIEAADERAWRLRCLNYNQVSQ